MRKLLCLMFLVCGYTGRSHAQGAWNLPFRFETYFLTGADFGCMPEKQCFYLYPGNRMVSHGFTPYLHQCMHSFEVNIDSALEVELQVRCDSSENNGYGLILFGNDDKKKLDRKAFLMRTDGSFAYAEFWADSSAYLIDWTHSDAIQTSGYADNTLRLSQSRMGIKLYINDSLVCSLPPKRGVCGHYFGVCNIGKQTVSFERFSIVGTRRRPF